MMMDRIKQKMRRVWTYFVFGVGMSVALASAPAEAQTYVRPSKGTGFVAVTNSAVAVGDSAVTSAVYDMSAFSEVTPQFQLVQESPLGARSTYTRSWSVTRFGRYIRFIVSTPANGSPPILPGYTVEAFPAYVNVQTSENAAGPFVDYAGGGSDEMVTGSPNPAWVIKAYSLSVTPIPFQSVQYTRFAKGEPTVLLNRVVNGDGSLSFFSPPIDMTSYAGVSIRVTNETSGCNPGLGIWVYEGDTDQGLNSLQPGPTYRTPKIRNRIVNTDGNYAYAIPVTSKYLRFWIFETTDLPVGTNVCATPFVVTVTPLPYEPLTVYASPFSQVGISSLTGGTPGPALSVFGARYSKARIQNLGAGPAECSNNSTSIRWPIKIPPDTGLTGAGGVVEINDYGTSIYCRATTATTTTLGIFSY